MLLFFEGKPRLGIELTATEARFAAFAGRGAKRSLLFSRTVAVPPGSVNVQYATLNILDHGGFVNALREGLAEPSGHLRRAALSLPDGVFRVQTIDLEELPSRKADCERLIRWKLEKGAFDVADTLLRFQVLRRSNGGSVSVLACVAKEAVIRQYEEALAALGLETWSVGLASFDTLNYYASRLATEPEGAALVLVSPGSYTTVITCAGQARFYRYKELKRAAAQPLGPRLLREIDDSLHFFSHQDRSGQFAMRRLFLAGEEPVVRELAEGFHDRESFAVEILSPAAMLPAGTDAGAGMAAALGAGGSLPR